VVTAILAAAGRGRRFGAPENKVFAPLLGRTVLHWSAVALQNAPSIDRIVVVTASDDLPRVRDIVAPFSKVEHVCEGGAERSDSIWNALQHLPAGTELVAVHDGARPLVSRQLIDEIVAAARESGAALPATPVSDTVKRSEDGRETTETIDRSLLYAVQTPQIFATELLLRAYQQARAEGRPGTDDASLVERLGHAVRLVPGERTNLKITLPEDLTVAEALLRKRELGAMPDEIRTGFGYDVHRLVPGRRLVLGGVPLEHPEGLGLDGHSDADVLLHAISDALLGAAALGDLGQQFPNTDPR
jgi:2-C-methyl-D-erythritol 4-phosphate cytidylyltransferase/2-C-methyl-D-erythritol 2,4-cyclodiphosphate synthase